MGEFITGFLVSGLDIFAFISARESVLPTGAEANGFSLAGSFLETRSNSPSEAYLAYA